MAVKKGKFIVVDGLDGAGKKTQLDLLVKYLRKNKIPVATVDFPQYYKTFFGQLVSRYLKGEFGSLDQTNPYLVSLTYAGDRWQAKSIMEKTLKKGKLLLANRYVTSNMAFQAGKFSRPLHQKKFIDWAAKLEYGIYGLPKPDFMIYLTVPAAIGQKLVANKGKRAYLKKHKKQDLHEINLAYLERVKQVYDYLCQHQQKWIKINCLDTVGQLKTKIAIHQEIVKVLQSKKIMV